MRIQRIVTKLRMGQLGSLGPEVWLLSSTILLGAMNYLSHSLVGRLLGPADYGVFATLNSFSLVWSVLTGAIQAIVADNVARMVVRGRLSEVGSFLVYAVKRLLPWGICCTLVLMILANPLATFLQLSPTSSMIVISFLFIPIFVLPVAMGGLRGLQHFGQFARTQIFMGLLRLLTAVTLVSIGLGVAGAVASLPVSSLGAFIAGGFFLKDIVRQRKTHSVPKVTGLVPYSIFTILAMGCFAVLTNGDVVFVKSRFVPDEAGLYAAVATVGKTVLWISGALVTLLLPRAATEHVRKKDNSRVLKRSLTSVVLLCGGAGVLLLLFHSPIMRVFFGEQYLAQAQLLGLYGVAMVLYSLVNVWLFYYLAIRDNRYAYMLFFGTTAFLASLFLYGDSVQKVVFLMILSGFMLFLVGGLLFLYHKRRW